jgi:hypothetical protein
MFTGGVKCCTFLFIDVIVCLLVCVTFCAVVSFLILDVDVFKEGLFCTLIFQRYSK